MTIKIYSDVGSGSCRRVNAVIRHLGINVEYMSIDLLAGENCTDEFLALNANGMVPILVDTKEDLTEVVLTEASAIMIYLCEKFSAYKSQETSLWPTGDKRFEVTKWMFWAAEHFRQSAPIYFEEKVIARLLGAEEDSHRISQANRMLERFSKVLDSHLKGRDYVVGNHLTLADFDLAAALSQMPRTHIPYDKYENIIRWEIGLNNHVDAWKTTGIELNTRMNKALSKITT